MLQRPKEFLIDLVQLSSPLHAKTFFMLFTVTFSLTPERTAFEAYNLSHTAQFSWVDRFPFEMHCAQYQLSNGISSTGGSIQETWNMSSHESHIKHSLPCALPPQCLQLQTLNTLQSSVCSNLVSHLASRRCT